MITPDDPGVLARYVELLAELRKQQQASEEIKPTPKREMSPEDQIARGVVDAPRANVRMVDPELVG